MSLFAMTKTVIKSFFHKPYTTKYPFVPATFKKGTRGSIQIEIDKCIFCSICAKRCPTFALTVDKNERSWGIERLKCITCNICVEACPKKCLSMEQKYAPSVLRTGTVDKFIASAPAPKPAVAAPAQ